MSFGILSINDNDRAVLDETYAHYLPLVNNTQNNNVGYPTEALGTDIVVARTVVGTNGEIARGIFPSGSSYDYYVLRKFTGYVTPPTTGMGLKIMDASGGSIISIPQLEKTFPCVASGLMATGTNSPTYSNKASVPNIQYFPSIGGTVPDLDKYFCVVVNASRILFSVPFGGATTTFQGFEYIWTGGTSGRIAIHNYVTSSGLYWPAPSAWFYLILKETG